MCVPPTAICPRDCACAFENGIDIIVGKQLSTRNNKHWTSLFSFDIQRTASRTKKSMTDLQVEQRSVQINSPHMPCTHT